MSESLFFPLDAASKMQNENFQIHWMSVCCFISSSSLGCCWLCVERQQQPQPWFQTRNRVSERVLGFASNEEKRQFRAQPKRYIIVSAGSMLLLVSFKRLCWCFVCFSSLNSQENHFYSNIQCACVYWFGSVPVRLNVFQREQANETKRKIKILFPFAVRIIISKTKRLYNFESLAESER